MIINYFRSSSYNDYSRCEQSYFLKYVLGLEDLSGKAALKGTIVHKVLEIIAHITLAKKQKKRIYNDEILGKIKVNRLFMWNDELLDVIDEITIKVYTYYTENSKHIEWKNIDKTDCIKWTHKILDYNNKQFDPRNRDIVAPEMQFDFEIEQPWAVYKDEHNQNNFLGLKGTIDLVTRISDKHMEVIDYKTGGYRTDWATGKEKTLDYFQNEDMQNRIYHYAVHKKYPELELVLVTMFYVNAGGAFTVSFDKSDLLKTEMMLKKQFLSVKRNDRPMLINGKNSWQCRRFCNFGKNTFDDTNTNCKHVTSMKEFRRGEICNLGQTMTKCQQVRFNINKIGMARVVKEYTQPGYTLSHYQDPGQVL